jgi:hypothetical protein
VVILCTLFGFSKVSAGLAFYDMHTRTAHLVAVNEAGDDLRAKAARVFDFSSIPGSSRHSLYILHYLARSRISQLH